MSQPADESEDREQLLQQAVDKAISRTYDLLWDGKFTAAESRLAWLQVINKMVESVTVDTHSNVIMERLKLYPRR